MIELNNAFAIIYKGIASDMSAYGFKAVLPEGTAKNELPLFERGNAKFLEYRGDKGAIRILFSENKIRFLTGNTDAASEDDSDYTLICSYLLVLDEYDERDVKSTTNEIIDNLHEAYSKKALAKKQASDIKAQATVSRSQVKSGALLYDPDTLVMRLALMFPEFKDEYRQNVAENGEFLCEEFFTTVANEKILGIIKENNQLKMKKLFGILNEIYDDGSNEVQGLITVTVLGQINNDALLMQNILPYLGDNMMDPVLRVNKYLAKTKSARMRLENPPKYKPKKKKKSGGFMDALMGGAGGGIPQ